MPRRRPRGSCRTSSSPAGRRGGFSGETPDRSRSATTGSSNGSTRRSVRSSFGPCTCRRPGPWSSRCSTGDDAATSRRGPPSCGEPRPPTTWPTRRSREHGPSSRSTATGSSSARTWWGRRSWSKSRSGAGCRCRKPAGSRSRSPVPWWNTINRAGFTGRSRSIRSVATRRPEGCGCCSIRSWETRTPRLRGFHWRIPRRSPRWERRSPSSPRNASSAAGRSTRRATSTRSGACWRRSSAGACRAGRDPPRPRSPMPPRVDSIRPARRRCRSRWACSSATSPPAIPRSGMRPRPTPPPRSPPASAFRR